MISGLKSPKKVGKSDIWKEMNRLMNMTAAGLSSQEMKMMNIISSDTFETDKNDKEIYMIKR